MVPAEFYVFLVLACVISLMLGVLLCWWLDEFLYAKHNNWLWGLLTDAQQRRWEVEWELYRLHRNIRRDPFRGDSVRDP